MRSLLPQTPMIVILLGLHVTHFGENSHNSYVLAESCLIHKAGPVPPPTPHTHAKHQFPTHQEKKKKREKLESAISTSLFNYKEPTYTCQPGLPHPH